MPKSTADENFNHNYFIIAESSFTVQLTLVMETAVYQRIFITSPLFCFKNVRFLFINYRHKCLLITLFL